MDSSKRHPWNVPAVMLLTVVVAGSALTWAGTEYLLDRSPDPSQESRQDRGTSASPSVPRQPGFILTDLRGCPMSGSPRDLCADDLGRGWNLVGVRRIGCHEAAYTGSRPDGYGFRRGDVVVTSTVIPAPTQQLVRDQVTQFHDHLSDCPERTVLTWDPTRGLLVYERTHSNLWGWTRIEATPGVERDRHDRRRECAVATTPLRRA
jgi:hypothetical protein